ncbi:MAG: FtsQ-type POTRA domain-containing protein [Bryobacter sp.]|nr:FtsQ-type POTRA domain-containing protein [Bryobacter sp.]
MIVDTSPAKKSAKRQKSRLSGWMQLGAAVGLVFGVAVVFLGWQAAESFLVRDARFVLPPPLELGEEGPNLKIEGLRHASQQQVQQLFQNDYGRSVYLFPLVQRRRELLAIDWVKDASISRHWPNRITVRVQERIPVAFIQVPAEDGGAGAFALIDEDGVILTPNSPARFNLPVVTGVRREEPEASRKARIQRFLRMAKEMGPGVDELSEIDLAEGDNIKVRLPVAGRSMMLMLGNQHFRDRVESFKSHYQEMAARHPDATMFDLRLEDRITVIENNAATQPEASADGR